MVFTARAVIEVLGRPESHVLEVINKVIEKLKADEGITLIKHEISNPEVIKETFFASYAEVEIKVLNFSKLLSFCYDYLPTTIEILDSEKIVLSAREFSNGLNDSLYRLHQYNTVVNNLMAKQKANQ